MCPDETFVLDPLAFKTLVLLGLAFHGVTLVLYVLARQYQIAVQRHDLIREALQQRIDYRKTIDERREAINAARIERQANPMGLSSHARGDANHAPAGKIAPEAAPAAAQPAAKAA